MEKAFLDIANWPRKEHFEFFSKFEEPFFGAVIQIDCTRAYALSKQMNISFFLFYLHKTLMAVNAVEPFRYRIIDNRIAIYDRIDGSATISREDGSFGFSLIPFHKDFEVFAKNAAIEMDRVKNSTGLFTRSFDVNNLIHFSALPWLDFTSLSHARSFSFPDSCPKISFGKMSISENGRRSMPMSVHVHHGLMDGYHLGQFTTTFQEIMQQ